MATPNSTTSVVPNLTKPRPDLRTLFNQLTQQIFASLHCAQVGTIDSFDPVNQTAVISINTKVVLNYTQTTPSPTNTTTETSPASVTTPTPVTINYPKLYNVPVVCLGGGGGTLTFPIDAGDTCLVIFLDRDMQNYFINGETNVAPNTVRMHSISDPVAIVGLRSFQNPITSYSQTDVQLRGGGLLDPMISLDGERIGIENNVTSLLTTFNVLIDTLVAINTQLLAALTTLNAGGSLTAGAFTPEITVLTTVQTTTIPLLAADVLALLK